MPDSYGLVRGSEIDEDDAEVFGLSELDLGDLDLRFEKDSYGRVRFFVYKDDTFITDLEGPIDQAQIDMINPDNPEFIPDPGEAQRPGPDTSGDPEDPTVVDPDNVPKDADVVARRRREADFLNSSTHATGEIPVESTGEIHNDFNEVDNAEPGSKSDESTDFDEDAGDSEDEDAEKISDILDGNVGDVNSRIDELADFTAENRARDSIINVLQNDIEKHNIRISNVENTNIEVKASLVEIQRDIKTLLYLSGKNER